MSDATRDAVNAMDAVTDVDDEQAIAEELDDDRFDDDDGVTPEYPPDHALASLEASAPIETGDVPQDSLVERLWREEPDHLVPPDEAVDLVEPHPDAGIDPDFAAMADPVSVDGGFDDDGELVGQWAAPGSVPPAEESAIHIIDEDL